MFRHVGCTTALAMALTAACMAAPGAPRAPLTPDPSRAVGTPVRRGGYVGDLPAMLADAVAWSGLLRAVRGGVITEVIPYGAGPLLTTAAGRASLVRAIATLRAAGARVLLPIAGASRLDALAPLVAAFPAARPDGLVSELEFWNRPARAAALAELLDLLAAMRACAVAWRGAGPPIVVGAYLGYPTRAEAARIAAVVDLVLLDYSVRDPARAWGHVHARGGALRARLGWFARAGVAVWPILYARGEVDMHAALVARGPAAIEAQFRAAQAADSDPDLVAAAVAGFVYFTIEALAPGAR